MSQLENMYVLPQTALEEIRYKIAKSKSEKAEIFRFRHEILVQTDGYLKANESKMIFDIYDQMRQTILIAAYFHKEIVGSVRVVFPNKHGIPSDDYINFRECKDIDFNKSADLNRVCVRKDFRKFGLASELMRAAHAMAIKNGANYVCGVANPKALTLFTKLGWQTIGEQSYSKTQNLPFIPIIGRADALIWDEKNIIEQ